MRAKRKNGESSIWNGRNNSVIDNDLTVNSGYYQCQIIPISCQTEIQFMVHLVDLRHVLFCGWVLFLLFISFYFVLTYCLFSMCVLKSVSDLKKILLLSVSSILVLHVSSFFLFHFFFLGDRMLVYLFCSNLYCSYMYNISSTVMSFLPTTSYRTKSERKLKESIFWLSFCVRKKKMFL